MGSVHVSITVGCAQDSEKFHVPVLAHELLHAPQVKESLKRLMGSVHVSITAACAEYLEKFRRHVYVTPKSYMAFLEGYQDPRPLHDHLQRALAVQTPDWMARDFQEASKAIAAGEYATAVSLLKKVLEDGKDVSFQIRQYRVLAREVGALSPETELSYQPLVDIAASI